MDSGGEDRFSAGISCIAARSTGFLLCFIFSIWLTKGTRSGESLVHGLALATEDASGLW